MDPETAKKLFESGANVILLNVPPGTEIGIDMQSWRTGPEFKGIKMIPSGLHFIYFRFVHVFTTLVLFYKHCLAAPTHDKKYFLDNWLFIRLLTKIPTKLWSTII